MSDAKDAPVKGLAQVIQFAQPVLRIEARDPVKLPPVVNVRIRPAPPFDRGLMRCDCGGLEFYVTEIDFICSHCNKSHCD